MTRLRVRTLQPDDRQAALSCLERAPRLNLHLTDQVLRLGHPTRRGEPRSELLGAWRGQELAAILGIQPSVVLDASAGREAVEAFMPYLGSVGAGLLKSLEDVVAPLWDCLEDRGRRAILDRIENAYALELGALIPVVPPAGLTFRSARLEDLDALIEAARESLLEESRPDPSVQDPAGFRRWVRSRIPRALVGTEAGRLVFVGYADVQCDRGWLLQGIFTWKDARRRGIAAAGVTELCQRAFAASADHVQLAVVEGNVAAEQLYEALGFERFARLRTLLFG